MLRCPLTPGRDAAKRAGRDRQVSPPRDGHKSPPPRTLHEICRKGSFSSAKLTFPCRPRRLDSSSFGLECGFERVLVRVAQRAYLTRHGNPAIDLYFQLFRNRLADYFDGNAVLRSYLSDGQNLCGVARDQNSARVFAEENKLRRQLLRRQIHSGSDVFRECYFGQGSGDAPLGTVVG